jgi:hypothetical protein
MGMPMQFNVRDYDTLMPLAEDIISDAVRLGKSIQEKYTPQDLL